MRRVLAIALVIVWMLPGVASAGTDVSTAELVGDSSSFDGAVAGEISVRGELIGDFLRRGAWVWVQLNDDSYVDAPLLAGGAGSGANVGVGVRIPVDVFDALDLNTPGGYRVRGPIVRVVGEWRYHDPDRGGESYLDVLSVELLSSEQLLAEGANWAAMMVGLSLLALAGLGTLLRRRQ